MSGKRTIHPVTHAQQQVLDFIVWFTGQKGYPPSLTDLQKHFRWASATGSRNHLLALRLKGRVTWEKGKARTLTIVAESAP